MLDAYRKGELRSPVLDETETFDEETYSQLPIEGQAQTQQDDNVEDTKYEVDGKNEIVDEVQQGELMMNNNQNDEIQDQDKKENEEFMNKSQQKNSLRYSDAFKLKVVQYNLNHTQRQTAAKFGVSQGMVSKWSKKAETFVHGQSDSNGHPCSKFVNLNEQENAVKNEDVPACMDLDVTKTIDEETCSQIPTDDVEDQAEAQFDDNVVDSRYEIDEEGGEIKNHNPNDENQDQDGKYEELLNKSCQQGYLFCFEIWFPSHKYALFWVVSFHFSLSST